MKYSCRIFILGFVFFLSGAGLPHIAYSQGTGYEASSVQVDRSVLQQMDAARHNAAAQWQRYEAQRQYNNTTRPPLTPPKLPVIPPPSYRATGSYESVKEVQKTYKPTLTAPEGEQVDTYLAPVPLPDNTVPAETSPHDGNIVWNTPSSSGAYQNTMTAAAPEQDWRDTQIKAPATTPVAFPVKVKQRTDSFDPGLEKNIPTGKALSPVSNVKKETVEEKATVSPPVPSRKPVIKKKYYGDDSTKEIMLGQVTGPASTGSIIKQDLPDVVGMQVPVPKRRPAIQTASLDFVNEARQGMNMPAIMPNSVEAEALRTKAAYSNDDLGKTLKEPDRTAVVEHVNALMPEEDKKKQLNTAPSPVQVKKKDSNRKESRTVTASIEKQTEKMPRPPADDDDNNEKKFISMPFTAGSSDLDIRTQKSLNENVLLTLNSNPEWRVQIQAFAAADREGQTSARRLSLSRALSVRDYLMENGIDSKRIDVRALGAQTNRTPADRVDMVFFKPENG